MQTYLSTKVACQITRKHGTSGILNLFESTKLEHKGVVLAFLQMQFLSPGCKTKMPLGMPTPRGLLIFMPMQNLSSIPRWLLRFLCGTIHVGAYMWESRDIPRCVGRYSAESLTIALNSNVGISMASTYAPTWQWPSYSIIGISADNALYLLSKSTI